VKDSGGGEVGGGTGVVAYEKRREREVVNSGE